MDPSPLQSSEIDSSSSPIPPSLTFVLDIPKDSEKQQNPPTQNPSSPETLQIPLPQAPDPPNSEPQTLDPDLQEPEPEDPDDQEGIMLSPSNSPLISGANVSSRSSRRGPSRRGKRSFAKPHPRTVAALEKKMQALLKNMKSVPFVPRKALDFSRHEENLRRLGLWDFAHLEFDRKIRNDLLVKLIVTYNEKNRCSYVGDVRVLVNPSDLARALNLPCKKTVDCVEEAWPGEFISFVGDFVSSWMLLHEDTWMLPPEVMTWTGMIKEGHPEKVDWAKLIWFMVKRELAKGVQLENCYYASHLQHLIKCQKEVLLKEQSPDEVEEILVVKDDEEDEGDVKMVECDEVSHGGEPEMILENAPPSVESIDHVQSDVKMAENVDSLVVMDSVDDAGNVNSLGHGDKTTDCAVPEENQKTSGDQVESPKITNNQVESLTTTDDQMDDSLKTAVDHVEDLVSAAVNRVENLESAAVNHVENLESATVDLGENLESAAVDHVENLETAVDHVENLETAVVDHLENLNPPAVDHVEYLKPRAVENVEYLVNGGDQVDNLESTGDHVENLKPAAVDHDEYLEMGSEHVDNLASAGDAEDMNIDGDHVEDKKVIGHALEEIKTETNVVIDDDAEMQDTGCNDLIDFEVCKVDEHDPWDLSTKDGDQVHFLQQCTMSEAKLNEEQTSHHQEDDQQQAEEVEDDDEPEDDDPVQGFQGLSSGHLMQDIPYSASDFDNNHVMLGGPSPIFGNSSKRELDLDPEIPGHDTHKRMRTEAPSWDQKPQDLDFCLDQIQQWVEKSRMTSMSSQQATMTQQQLFFNELGSKDHIIQQLKMNIQTLNMKNDELQRRRQSEISRYEKELYAMSSVIDGYRKALKSTQDIFADYRKRSNLPPEPLYRDAGPGGVVKSVAELERERLKQEEDEKTARSMVELFEKEWVMKFEGLAEEAEKSLARVSDIEKGVEILKEVVGKKKGASEMVS